METEVLVLIAVAGGAILTKVLDIVHDHFKGKQARLTRSLELEHDVRTRQEAYAQEQQEERQRRWREAFESLSEAIMEAVKASTGKTGGGAAAAFVKVYTCVKKLEEASGKAAGVSFAYLADSSLNLAMLAAGQKGFGPGVPAYTLWWEYVEDVMRIGPPTT